MLPAHCRYCGKVLSALERYSGGYCSAAPCRERYLRDKLETFRDDAARQAGEARPDRFPIVVVPHRAGTLVPVGETLVRDLELRLIELAAVSADLEEDAVETSPPPEPLPAVCSTCQGVCCYYGGPHMAFIDEETIGRFKAQHPDVPAEAIPGAYLQHVPDRHFDGSCVFHTGAGCNLPRTLRARICNQYECRGLKLAREEGRREHDPLFIVVRHDNTIVRGEFVEPSRTRAATPVKP